MPRASMDGSIFPDLEREQMSTAHPRRSGGPKKPEGQTSKSGENKREEEKNEESES